MTGYPVRLVPSSSVMTGTGAYLNTGLSLYNAKSVTFVLGDYVQGCQKCFARGVSLWFQIEQIMNFILNESPSKMGSIDNN